MLASPITDMIRKLLNRLEDPKHPLLGPNIKALKFWGLLIPESKWGRFSVYLINLMSVMFIVCQYIDLWLIRSDMTLVFSNLRYSLISPFNVLKVTLFYVMQQRWTDIIDYVSRADVKMRSSQDPKNIEIIANNTKYCRRVTYVYWFLTYVTAITNVTAPIFVYLFSKTYRQNLKNGTVNYIEIIRCWVPFDKTELFGYLFAFSIQALMGSFLSGSVSSYDTSVVVIMMFFKTELMVLENDSSTIFDSPQSPIDDRSFKQNIKECHRRHVELLKYTDLFNSCLSYMMFFYVIVCSLMLCAAAYESTVVTNRLSYIVSLIYMIFCVAELFLFCWHGNEVLLASQKLMLGPYRSVWWGQRKEHLRDMFILINQFDKTVTFNAGPFTDLTVATLVSILKGTYSYLALIK